MAAERQNSTSGKDQQGHDLGTQQQMLFVPKEETNVLFTGSSREKFRLHIYVQQETRPLGAINYRKVSEDQVRISKERGAILRKELANKNLPPDDRSRNRLTPEYQAVLGDAVTLLSDQGRDPKQIAESIGVRTSWVEDALERKEKFPETVRNLRNLGYGNKRISELTREPVARVQNAIVMQRRRGEQVKNLRNRRTKEEKEKFDEELEKLKPYWEAGLITRQEIQHRLGASETQFFNGMRRIRAKENGIVGPRN
jgi:hypothetical protein